MFTDYAWITSLFGDRQLVIIFRCLCIVDVIGRLLHRVFIMKPSGSRLKFQGKGTIQIPNLTPPPNVNLDDKFTMTLVNVQNGLLDII